MMNNVTQSHKISQIQQVHVHVDMYVYMYIDTCIMKSTKVQTLSTIIHLSVVACA